MDSLPPSTSLAGDPDPPGSAVASSFRQTHRPLRHDLRFCLQIRSGRSTPASNRLTIENNTHGWQGEPTDNRVPKIHGLALPSAGSVAISSLRKRQPEHQRVSPQTVPSQPAANQSKIRKDSVRPTARPSSTSQDDQSVDHADAADVGDRETAAVKFRQTVLGQCRVQFSRHSTRAGGSIAFSRAATGTKAWRKPERIEAFTASREEWSGPGSNRRHRPFQGRALPTELPDQLEDSFDLRGS